MKGAATRVDTAAATNKKRGLGLILTNQIGDKECCRFAAMIWKGGMRSKGKAGDSRKP